MNLRLKKYLLLFLDILFVALLFVTIFVLVADAIKDVQPFYIIYMYLQFLALYMTFRLRHTSARIDVNVIYRFHLFNMLFSLFTVVTGYLELVKSFKGEGMMAANPGFFVVYLFSFFCAHFVIGVYIFCPRLSYRQSQMNGGGNSVGNGASESTQEALLPGGGDPRTHFVSFE